MRKIPPNKSRCGFMRTKQQTSVNAVSRSVGVPLAVIATPCCIPYPVIPLKQRLPALLP